MTFFDAGSFKESKLSMDHFREWANEIASSYLTSQVPPTDTLCKIAQAEELTPHQIETLAGESNKAIHQAKYASAKDKYLAADFPLADAKTALARLQSAPGGVKLAAAMPDPVVSDDVDLHKAVGVEPEVMDKTASVKLQLKHAEIKTASLKQKMDDKVYIEKCAADDAERRFIKEARQAVLQCGANSAERMKTLGGLDAFAKTAGMHAKARPTLAKLAYALAKEGLLQPEHAKTALAYFLSKEADIKAPEELISANLPGMVINGTHPLYITLKTFRDCADRLDDTRGRASIVDDKIEILRQRIRAL